jgi:hypothetical protein
MDTKRPDQRPHPGKKQAKLEQFLAALLSHPTVESAARSIGIGHTTAVRWLQDPVVAERRREAAREASRVAQTRMQETLTKAVDRLNTLLDAENESVQVSAVRITLDFNQRVIELAELRERLERLEQIAKSAGKGNYEQPISSTASGTVGKSNGAA